MRSSLSLSDKAVSSCSSGTQASGGAALKRRYFDWAATAPVDEAAAQAAQAAALTAYGNPSSIHAEGVRAREMLEDARERCARVLKVSPERLVFCGGGTEANALALHAVGAREGGGALLYSAVEHPAVRENCRLFEKAPYNRRVIEIAVEADGRVSCDTLEKACRRAEGRVRCAAVMAVNNETGAVMDLAVLSSFLRRAAGGASGRSVHIHSDLVQAAGKIPLDIEDWDLDSAALSAHKIGGPRGLGLLYLRRPLIGAYRGGGQEGGVRSGTENVAGAVAFAVALENRVRSLDTDAAAAHARMARLIAALRRMGRCTLIPADRGEDAGAESNEAASVDTDAAFEAKFSPWIVQAAFEGIPGEVFVRALDGEGIAISTGSACSLRQGGGGLRPVLKAMGLEGLSGVRFSQGWSTTNEDIDALIAAISRVLALY